MHVLFGLKIYLYFLIWTSFRSHENFNPRVLPRIWDPAFSEHLTSTPKVVILVTAFRSGSTFVGELFNQNPDILYDFETFHTEVLNERKGKGNYKGEAARHTDEELHMLHLQQILHNCTILPNAFLNVMNKYWRCAKTPEQNLELYGEEECDDREGWRGPSIHLIRRYLCQKRDAVVLKVIRLRRLADLELVKHVQSADVRVIQLFRDPRGMFRSRSGFKDIFQVMRNQLQWSNRPDKWTKLALEAHTECENYMRDIEYAENNPWLKKRYMKIRHDDMATNYLEIAHSLYDFIELPLPQIVEDYLREAVNSEDPVDKPNRARDDTARGGTLNTFKNSTSVNDKWLKWRIDAIRNVDKYCARFIKKMNWPFLLDSSENFFELEPTD